MFGDDWLQFLQENGGMDPMQPMMPPGMSVAQPPVAPPSIRPQDFNNFMDSYQPQPPASPYYDPSQPAQEASMGGGGLLDKYAMGLGGGSQGGGLLSGLFGNGSSQPSGGKDWGSMLMALGGGIASNATQGWGAGIGAGFQGAALANMRSKEIAKDEAYRQQMLRLKMAEMDAPDKPTELMRHLEAAGYAPGSPEYQQALRLSLAGKSDAPSGFRTKDDGTLEPIPGGPSDPAYLETKPDRANVPPGYRYDTEKKALVPIPGGPAGKLQQNTAAALAMLETGEKEMTETDAKNVLKNMGTLSGDLKGYLGAGDVGRAQRAVRLLVEAALRLNTGATAPDTEVTRYADMFTPQGTDGTATRTQKLRALENFVNSAKQKIEGSRIPEDAAVEDPLGIR